MKQKYLLTTIIFLILISAIAHNDSQNIPGVDSFYHMAHAKIYADKGILYEANPWAAFSIIKVYGADMWYGFHLFLIPFTYIGNQVEAMRYAGIFLTSLLLLMIGWALYRLKTPLAFVWPLLLFSSYDEMFRCLMLRPQALSMGFSAILLSFLSKGNWRKTALFCYALVFFHETFFWVIPFITIVYFITKRLVSGVTEWKAVYGAVIGITLAWLTHPAPLGVAHLLFIQLVTPFLIKLTGVSVSTPTEMEALHGAHIFSSLGALLFIWAIVIGYLLRVVRKPWLLAVSTEDRVLLYTSAFLSLATLLMTVFFTRRACDLWVVFSIICVATLFKVLPAVIEAAYIQQSETTKKKKRPSSNFEILFYFLVGGIYLFAAFSLHRNKQFLNANAIPPYRFEKAARWLQDNSNENSLVFNADWARFAELLFWDRHNRYIGGNDPIFMYQYNPKLYAIEHQLEVGPYPDTDCRSVSGSSIACRDEIYKALRSDFHASHIILYKFRQKRLYAFLCSDYRYGVTFDDGQIVIFSVRGVY